MTPEIILVLAVLVATIILFVTEAFRVDVIAILIMVTLPWLGLLTPLEAFSGLASNAVVAVIAVMILSYGVGRSGVMNRFSRAIISVAGTSERRLIGLVAVAVGLLSSFMQNIGAVALFLPAVMRIAKKMRIPVSRLLMPMGFAGILGGTLTLVGSAPLILLNDLLRQGGQEPFGLFGVTPIGIALLTMGIIYFLTVGKRVFPAGKGGEIISPQQELIETWDLPSTIFHCIIPPESPLIGKTREEAQIWARYTINLLALAEGDELLYAPWRYTRFIVGQELAILGAPRDLERFIADFRLKVTTASTQFEALRRGDGAGFAELIIPPRAPVAGKTMRQLAIRKTYGVEPIMLLSGAREEREDFSDRVLEPGDAMIVHGRWENIKAMADNRTFVLVTPIETESAGASRPLAASLCFLGAITLILLGVPLALGLLSGALAMIILSIVPIDEAYKAVDWRTVFLLAGLIPLGIAMEKTGAASFVATRIISPLQGGHPLVILVAIAALATLFSLFMSNAAATVVLVPLVLIIGEMTQISPRALALLVAVCAANSFVLPTHQVNALLMAPGGYHNADYLKAGGILTIIFIVIAVGLIYLLYV
ncbi:MAG TPA: SLC13 family permease [Methanomicrobia archaeon]|nr:SLC13 family permease [Methanomicrobia archaeon]